MSESGSTNIADFFEKSLPALLQRSRQAFSAVSGSISFVVTGAGAWKVILGPKATVVSAQEDFESDLVLFFARQAFERLLSGGSVEPGQGFIADGDERLLGVLGRLLLPASAGVAQLRASSF